MKKIIKLNVKKIIILLFNFILSISTFFFLRRIFLRVLFRVSIGRRSTFHRNVILFDIGKFNIGNNSTINYGCYLDNRGGINIGDNVNISHDVKIYTMGHDVNDPCVKLVAREVNIGSNSWVFPNVLIMPGVNISEGAVVYPGSVVTKKIPPYEIWGGNPAKFIGHRKHDIKYDASFPVWFAI
ncbi:TPA: acyltransferase [Raoultella ornithinolytica]